MLHVQSGQTIDVQGTQLNSSLMVYSNATVVTTSPLAIAAGATASIFGQICGADTIQVYGTLSLSSSATTCASNFSGKFLVDDIIVYNSATLTSVSMCDLQGTSVCLNAMAEFNTTELENYSQGIF
jgi:hypothetical protein